MKNSNTAPPSAPVGVIANDGESAPDYRWMNQYINEAADRYSVRLTSKEREQVAQEVRRMTL